LALDGISLGEYESASWGRSLAPDDGDNSVIIDRLATLNLEITPGGKRDFWGNSSYAISYFARIHLLVSLSTLDKNL